MELHDRWRAHPNASGPALMLLRIHDQFRAAARQLLRLVDTHRDVERLFTQLAAVLHHHHHAEEAMLFPLVHRLTGVAPDQLQTDHDEMTAAIEAARHAIAKREGVAEAITRFHGILVPHLVREEELVIPVLLELPPAELWNQLHR